MTTDAARWYSARDAMLLLDTMPTTINTVYRLCKKSNHPDAVWLCSVFEKHGIQNDCAESFRPRTDEWVHRQDRRYHSVLQSAFRAELPDPRADCFMIVLDIQFALLTITSKRTLERLQKCDSYSLSMAFIAEITFDSHLLDLAVSKGDSYAMNSNHMYKEAALLGHVEACTSYVFEIRGHEGYTGKLFHYMGMALSSLCKRGVKQWIDQVSFYCKRNTQLSGPCRYEIGNMWKIVCAHINNMNVKLTSVRMDRDMIKYAINECNKCVKVTQYNDMCTFAAVDTWILVALRINRQRRFGYFNRDIRKMIGRLIWSTRSEGLYEYVIKKSDQDLLVW